MQQKQSIGRYQELKDEISQQIISSPIYGPLTEQKLQFAGEKQRRRYVEMTGLLIYFHTSPINTHLHTQRNTDTSFILPELHCELILAHYFQQCDVGEEEKNTKQDTGIIIFHYYAHMLNSITVSQLKAVYTHKP